MAETKELQAKEKQELYALAEPTQTGPVFSPAVDIFETDKEMTLLADLPGVKSDHLNIDLRDNVLTLAGEVTPWEGADEEDLFIEYEIGRYFRQFSISEVIDQNRIDAKLNDGVLRLRLPKVEKVIPRKISMKSG
jgi:HSP20 family molecular chaperone IbpA